MNDPPDEDLGAQSAEYGTVGAQIADWDGSRPDLRGHGEMT